MKSKAKFDLNENNKAIITLEIAKDSTDLRDVIACQFVQNLRGNIFCLIECKDTAAYDSIWTITPLSRDDFDSIKK